jgi:hypothetical protein
MPRNRVWRLRGEDGRLLPTKFKTKKSATIHSEALGIATGYFYAVEEKPDAQG